jgi:hypothetical protein
VTASRGSEDDRFAASNPERPYRTVGEAAAVGAEDKKAAIVSTAARLPTTDY